MLQYANAMPQPYNNKGFRQPEADPSKMPKPDLIDEINRRTYGYFPRQELIEHL